MRGEKKGMLYALYLLALGVGGYAIIAGYLYFFQRHILYLPEYNTLNPAEHGFTNVDKIRMEAEPGLFISAWQAKPKKSKPIIVYFHGNAGHLADRSEKLHHFINAGYGLLAVSYRGYGDSQGHPSEAGLYNDARAALNYLTEEQRVKEENIVLYGESLGSGIATQMALEYPKCRLLALEAPYTSIANRAAELYPYIPVRYLIKDHFSTVDKIAKVHVPLLLFHGELDETMPIHHGRKLLELANEPKRGLFYPTIGHTDFDPAVLTAEIGKSLEQK